MAELVGVVASITPFISLVEKISACVLALRGLLAEIKDVSSKLSAMMREIEILEPIVEAMRREFNVDNYKLSTWNDDTALLAIEYCKKALEDLNSVLVDLVEGIGSSRKMKRYKAIMKTIIDGDVLDRCHARLQSAVHFLSLTQQWHIIALLKAQPTIIVQHLSRGGLVYRSKSDSNATFSPESKATDELLRRRKGITRPLATRAAGKESGAPRYTNLWNFGPLGSIAWRYYQDEKRFHPKDFNFIARLQANYWFASQVWDIQASRAATGWTLKLNVYSIQPDSAPVFCCARNGDIAGILRLFDLGKASLQDHTPSGQSLMHIAAEYGHLDLLKVLTANGLDAFERDSNLKLNSCETMVVFGVRHGTNITALHEFYLENDIYSECGLLVTHTTSVHLFEAVSFAPPELIKVMAPSAVPGFYEKLDLEQRIKYYSFHNPDSHPDTLQHLINPSGGISREDISDLQQKHGCLLVLVAFHYGPISMRETSCHLGPWRKLAQKVIQLTEDLSLCDFSMDPTFQDREFINGGQKFNPVFEFLRQNQPLTALFTALSYFRYETQEDQLPTCTKDLKRRIQTTLTWWLEDLAACKVNLIKYGRRERRIFLRNENLKRAYYYCGGRIEGEQTPEYAFEDRIRLVDFEYGAKPSDWRLHWDAEIERYAGDFWNLVEKCK
ncbi:hypothetical protein F4860DRAFT_458705 [Xylaria cubensis]|nr:hypothetical protein F4860DRAFT_458705 [Xylaria cubensis]